ncbi:MAG: hypothetical protein AAFO88_09645 [Pseudomonadota bacterium]
MDERHAITLMRGWALVASVLEHLARLPGVAAGLLPASVWRAAWRELRLAEAAARRMIIVLSHTTPRPERPACPQGAPEATPPARTRKTQPRERRAPFNLSDRPLNPFAGLGLGGGPAAPILPNEGARCADGLKDRMAALKAVLDDPASAAARYVRLRDWPRTPAAQSGRRPRLRPGHPPGYDRRKWTDWDMDILMEVHTAAMEVLNARAPRAWFQTNPCPAS